MTIETVERMPGRLYTAFVMRDLTFFVSGALVLASVNNQPIASLSHRFSGNITDSWLGIVAFLAISYVIGVLLQEAARLILEPASRRWIQFRLGRPESSRELVARLESISKSCTEYTLTGIERVLFLKQIGATQFSALITIAIIRGATAPAHTQSSLLIGILLLAALLCFWVYIDKSRQQEIILTDLETQKGIASTTNPRAR